MLEVHKVDSRVKALPNNSISLFIYLLSPEAISSSPLSLALSVSYFLFSIQLSWFLQLNMGVCLSAQVKTELPCNTGMYVLPFLSSCVLPSLPFSFVVRISYLYKILCVLEKLLKIDVRSYGKLWRDLEQLSLFGDVGSMFWLLVRKERGTILEKSWCGPNKLCSDFPWMWALYKHYLTHLMGNLIKLNERTFRFCLGVWSGWEGEEELWGGQKYKGKLRNFSHFLKEYFFKER